MFDNIQSLAFAADYSGILASTGGDFTVWQSLAVLKGRFIVSDLDLFASHLLRQNAPISILANQYNDIIRIDLLRASFVSLERYGYRRVDIGGAARGVRLAEAMAQHISASGWRVRSSLGSAGIYDVLPSYLGDMNIWLHRAKADFAQGLILAGREYAEPGKYIASSYDVNSAYGSACTEVMLPDPKHTRLERGLSVRQLLGMLRSGRFSGAATVEAVLPSDRYGILPIKDGDAITYNREGGTVTGTWCFNELEYALELGASISRVDEALYGERCATYLADFARDCYDEKLAAQQAGDAAGRQFWKLLCNATIGRLSSRGGLYMCDIAKYGTKHIKPPKGYTGLIFNNNFVLLVKRVQAPDISNRLWNGLIVAHQRVKIHRLATKYNAFYVDTDAFVCDPQEIPVGMGMGELSQVGCGTIEIVGTKRYRSSFGDAKARGISKAMANAYLSGETITISRRRSWHSSGGMCDEYNVELAMKENSV